MVLADELANELTSMVTKSGVSNTPLVLTAVKSLKCYARASVSAQLTTLAGDVTELAVAASEYVVEEVTAAVSSGAVSLPTAVTSAIVVFDKVLTAYSDLTTIATSVEVSKQPGGTAAPVMDAAFI